MRNVPTLPKESPMLRSRRFRRALAAALAASALGAPAAVARPLQDVPPKQDLRALSGTSSLAGTTAPAQRPAQPAATGGDTPWAEIGIGLAGAAIAAGGAGLATAARRRSRVTV